MFGLHYLSVVLSFALAVILISKLLHERRAPGSMLAWLLGLVLVPYLTVPLYLVFGGRKIKKAALLKKPLHLPLPHADPGAHEGPIERLLLRSGAPKKTSANEVRLLSSGKDAYCTLLEQIRSARSSIHVTTFILGTDATGLSILSALSDRARQGIQVRLLLDGMGSFWIFRARLKRFHESGGRSAFFLPLIHTPFFGHSNLRNHRKMAIIDGRTAVIGGMNLSGEYMAPEEDAHQWVDLSLLIEGPAVADLENLFCADWKFAAGESLMDGIVGLDFSAHSGETLQVVPSGPDIEGDPLYDSIISAVFSAKERIWIATPYYIPDEALSKALELAAKRGVDVKVVIPRRSNHWTADICRGSYLRELEKAGGKIHYFRDRMMHAKAVLIDDTYSVVGSANLDMRSLLLNFEVGVFIYSKPGLEKIATWFEALFSATDQIRVEANWGSGLLDGLGRIIGPLL